MIRDHQHTPATWPAFAGEKSEDTMGPTGHGNMLLITHLSTLQCLVLNVSRDTRLSQEPAPPRVAESNGQAYETPKLSAAQLGIQLRINLPDGTRARWPSDQLRQALTNDGIIPTGLYQPEPTQMEKYIADFVAENAWEAAV